jgi:hypothetical protein
MRIIPRNMSKSLSRTAEHALGYKLADRHHGKTGLRDIRMNDVANEPIFLR